jgi:hypothetical protein
MDINLVLFSAAVVGSSDFWHTLFPAHGRFLRGYHLGDLNGPTGNTVEHLAKRYQIGANRERYRTLRDTLASLAVHLPVY